MRSKLILLAIVAVIVAGCAKDEKSEQIKSTATPQPVPAGAQ